MEMGKRPEGILAYFVWTISIVNKTQSPNKKLSYILRRRRQLPEGFFTIIAGTGTYKKAIINCPGGRTREVKGGSKTRD